MDAESPLVLVGSLLVLLAIALLAGPYLPALAGIGDADDRATVTVLGEDNETLAVVDARVADTPDERYRGLSGTESLEAGTGMLFVFASESNVSFVMRDMNYPLDIVFIGADGRITTIHSAAVPPENASGSELERYAGRAKWVLEVPRGWAETHNVSVGDRAVIER